jgi:hypothetical protein
MSSPKAHSTDIRRRTRASNPSKRQLRDVYAAQGDTFGRRAEAAVRVEECLTGS